MWQNKKYQHLAIGLIVMGLTLITYAFDYPEKIFNAVRGLQLIGTISLFYGIKKQQQVHKQHFVGIWLCTSAVSLLVFSAVSFFFLEAMFSWWDFASAFFSLLGCLLATAAIAFGMIVIYKSHIEAMAVNTSALSANERTAIRNPFEQQEKPPAYVAPTSEQLSVSVQS
ncbi:uncharacterized protein LOC108595633 isoform X2 [Drosophila busckii]|uniref:uncharacterized protein LOC108595633 isoform X2 n=1 Tax=Drosophila busckii TaxID=30019 RepID=UPI00083F00A5|nr:uncharacterized protein LOC108595633 isoform X2 [Drosophila busckii]